MYDFCILGNDKRFIALEEYLKKEKFTVLSYDFDKNDRVECKYLIMPIPVLNKEKYINVCQEKITLQDVFERISVENSIFGGGVLDIKSDTVKYINILEDEEFAIKNAVLTAESAISVLHSVSDKAIFNSKCLVVGNGRIGKILSGYLCDLKAKVTVSARRKTDFAWIEANGFDLIHTNDVKNEIYKYDIIFNTADVILFDETTQVNMKPNAVFIDLASYPGSVLNENENIFNGRYLRALGLPGKNLPDSAGKIILDVLIRTIKEEGEALGCKK